MTSPHSSDVVFSGYPIEVTKSEFERTCEDDESKKSVSHKSMSKRIGNLLSTSRKKKNHENSDDTSDNDRFSISGISNHGQQSVANKTVDSGTTIKASNLNQSEDKVITAHLTSKIRGDQEKMTRAGVENEAKKHQNSTANNKNILPGKPWKSLKRLVSKGRRNKDQAGPQEPTEKGFPLRRHTTSHDGNTHSGLFSPSPFLNIAYPMRKRFYSEGVDAVDHKPALSGAKSFSGGITGAEVSQHAIDQAIRGRLDGIDVLCLGPANRTSLPAQQSCDTDHRGKDIKESLDPLSPSFANLPQSASPEDLVEEMVLASGGMRVPEVILEGFYPGGHDRWGVRIPPIPFEGQKTKGSVTAVDKDKKPPSIDPHCDADDESTAVSSSQTQKTEIDDFGNIIDFWNNLWGLVNKPPPIPSHMNVKTIRAESIPTNHCDDGDHEISDDEESVQKLVETCNVPIDLDDDAFIIDGPQHLQTVHELIMIPLQSRRFHSVISIFEKLQRGLEGNDKFGHLIGSTQHNIGMIHLYRRDYEAALASFGKAVETRRTFLSCEHPDIVVSLQRKGMAHFALGSVNEALTCFEEALAINTCRDNSRAKILNNIGVARYQLRDYVQALKSFTSALEIQRPWLEGPIRRESVVYSASIILSNMGNVYLRNGDNDLAYFVFEEACLMQTATFRKDHDVVLQSLDNMGRSQMKNGNYAEALRIFTSLHRSQEARFGPDSAICIETMGMMGVLHLKLLEFDDAEACMRKVEVWQTMHDMDESHPSVRNRKEQMSEIIRCTQGKEPMWV